MPKTCAWCGRHLDVNEGVLAAPSKIRMQFWVCSRRHSRLFVREWKILTTGSQARSFSTASTRSFLRLLAVDLSP